jgi:hypothetical protein
MFQSLDEQMKRDAALEATPRQRMMKWGVIAVAAVGLFGGLCFAIQIFA